MVDSLIHAYDLLNLNPKKGCFTWTNNRLGLARISARLDRFLVQSSLLDFGVLSSTIMPKLTSDHHSIALLLEREENFGPLPFRFNPLWAKRDGFGELISQVWSQFIVSSPSFVWEQKLKLTKAALKRWIKFPSKLLREEGKRLFRL